MIKNVIGASVVVVLLLAAAAVPRASAETWHLNSCDASLCAGGTPITYGTITTTLTSGKVAVSIVMTSGWGLYGTSAFAFNVVSPDTAVTITGLTAGFTVGATNQNVSGFGTYEFTINGPSSVPGGLLNFTVNRTGGFTSASQIDEFSSGSASLIAAYFAGHVKKIGTTQAGWSAAGLATPEPATLALVATGVVGGLGAWVRRRRAASRVPLA